MSKLPSRRLLYPLYPPGRVFALGANLKPLAGTVRVLKSRFNLDGFMPDDLSQQFNFQWFVSIEIVRAGAKLLAQWGGVPG